MLFPLLSLIALVVACTDGEHHDHVHAMLGYPQVPLTPPYRPLVWGDFNVIHTTDTHGWLLGHQRLSWPEPNYSGDLGDFASFVTHMKEIAKDKDVDLLLVDSGDLHDGNGLSDGYPDGEVDGHRSSQFFKDLPYDLMTIGNHELYSYAVAYDMLYHVNHNSTMFSLITNTDQHVTVGGWLRLVTPFGSTYHDIPTDDLYTNFGSGGLNGRYLASNVNITIPGPSGEAVSVPIGNRHVKFQTSKNRTVTSFGVLFNFTHKVENITLQSVTAMVDEDWFKQVIAEDTDLFVLVGHMPVSNDSWPDVFNAIRRVERHRYTPILIFGGHSHIRDCQQYDPRSIALESGYYMQTIGWASANLTVAIGNEDPIAFTRRYLDQNRVTYEYHTTQSNTTFDTDHGRNITKGLLQLASDYNLGLLYGTAPHDYTTNRDPYPSNGNLVSLFIKEAAPYALAINNTRAKVPNIIIANADLLRYDIFNGPFTKNDQLSASPYLDSFLYIASVNSSVANKVLPALNDKTKLPRENWPRVPELVQRRYHAWLGEMSADQVGLAMDTSNLTIGYVTKDNCSQAGGAGDDTLHVLPRNYSLPDYVSSDPPKVADDAEIDLVFINFIESRVLKILNGVQNITKYTDADVKPYSPTLTNAVLGLYARDKWNGDTDN